MSYRTILIDLSAECPVGSRLAVAGDLAARFKATLVGLHVVPPPILPVGFYGDMTGYLGTELVAAQQAAGEESKRRAKLALHDLCGDGPTVIWREAEGDPGNVLAAAARATDLVLTEKGTVDAVDPLGAIEFLVLSSGVPVLMLPPKAATPRGETIVVGWNGSREATRAIHAALPFLTAARHVVLCSVGEASKTLEDAHQMLRRHGVPVEPRHVAEPPIAAGEALLYLAHAEGADLLVMGAYGHTRLRELVFGGATRHVLREAVLPVLFSG